MRTLRLGMEGDDVKSWEYFLCGQGHYGLEVDGKFDAGTDGATKDFQKAHGFTPDGIAGRMTIAAAMVLGFDPLIDDSTDKSGPNWPGPPDFKPLAGNEAKAQAFGAFRFKPAGVPGNPEAIQILDNWYANNIVQVEIPQLAGLTGTAGLRKFSFHKLAAAQFVGFFQAVETAGLKDRIKTWGGSYAARFIRGSLSVLSNHSFGSAADLNVPWNMLGAQGALVGQPGSVRELVPIAYKFGLYWGGLFPRPRPDAMHFEIAKLMSADEVKAALEGP